MWRSLKQVCVSATLHVLCLDDACKAILGELHLPDVHLYSLDELEAADEDLSRARVSRALVEYYFTLTPCLPLHILKTHPEVPRLTYLDADLFFFADPQPVLDEIGPSAVGLIEHRFPNELADLEGYGRFNTGWVTLRNDSIALRCLERWREQCLEWCYDRVEPGRFAEQKYLDDWPAVSDGIHVVQHRGANVAPWNLNRFEISLHEEGLRVGGQPLLFFHAHGFEPRSPGRRRALNLAMYRVEESRLLLDFLFGPYEQALIAATTEIAVPLALTLQVDRSRGSALQLERLNAQLSMSEADRDARLEVIRTLQAHLESSESDCAARLDVIHGLQRQLESTEAGRATLLSVITDLEKRLEASSAREKAHPASTRVDRFSRPPASPFRCWIDEPAAGKSLSSHLVVRGWCYQPQGLPVIGIRARIGRRTFRGVHGEARPDVQAFFGDERGSDNSGYQVSIVVDSTSTACEIDAQLSDGSWHTVQSVLIDAPGRRPWRERLKWVRFWWHSWSGRPDAWNDLTPLERDFVVTRARTKGWFNLDATAQHAPRPLLQERFPQARLPIEYLPRLVAVTPSLQQGTFLEQAMCSVLNQDGVRLDYVVQDGGSTDGSVDLIRKYAHRLAHWESAPDGGQAAAIVRGYSKVRLRPEDLMMYLNSDDVLMPGACRFVAEYFARHPDVDVVYGHRVLIDEHGQEVGRWFTPRKACDDLRLVDFVPQETMFWRKRIWDRVGGIDASFKFALDWDLLLRFKAAGACFARLPWFLGCFRLHSQQKTLTRLREDGIPEMEALRRRTFGRTPTHEELHLAIRRAQLDSALVSALFQWGWRA